MAPPAARAALKAARAMAGLLDELERRRLRTTALGALYGLATAPPLELEALLERGALGRAMRTLGLSEEGGEGDGEGGDELAAAQALHERLRPLRAEGGLRYKVFQHQSGRMAGQLTHEFGLQLPGDAEPVWLRTLDAGLALARVACHRLGAAGALERRHVAPLVARVRATVGAARGAALVRELEALRDALPGAPAAAPQGPVAPQPAASSPRAPLAPQAPSSSPRAPSAPQAPSARRPHRRRREGGVGGEGEDGVQLAQRAHADAPQRRPPAAKRVRAAEEEEEDDDEGADGGGAGAGAGARARAGGAGGGDAERAERAERRLADAHLEIARLHGEIARLHTDMARARGVL